MTMQAPSVQWFPGHMAKTRRLIQKNLTLVDFVIELTDARIPSSSRNPELDGWLLDKPRLLLLNKADLADPQATKQWIDYYQQHRILAISTDCKSGKGLAQVLPIIKLQLTDLLKRRHQKGMIGRSIRVMVVGIPNVGKSAFINYMTKSKHTNVQDRPGVTRHKQWVRMGKEMDLLDMPGVLWPKFEDAAVGEKLAFTGAVKDEVVDIVLLAMRLLWLLKQHYPQSLYQRYGLTPDQMEGLDQYQLLNLLGKKRGMLLHGGVVNDERVAIMLLDEFRGGKFGAITLELVPSIE